LCGIVGILNFDGSPVDRNLLESMTARIAHRGPSGEGIFIKDSIGIGNRRLAIIDPKGGKQPLCNEDGKVWITHNGEIYNFPELRSELVNRGHQFQTHSDTETVVHAYEQWGEKCVEHFRGMFAFAIIDLRLGKLFLARDQLGIKPLYILRTDKFLAFASEIQVLRHIPDLVLNLDLHALDQYLWLQYIPAPQTIFTQVSKLSPAHRISFSLDGHTNGPEEYWSFNYAPNYKMTEGEWIEASDAVLRDSVRAHLISDVPFGAFLSGGVDSSLVVSYMSQILNTQVKTFAIGFDEPEFNEIEYAEQASDRWNTEHHVEIVHPDAVGILPALVAHYGEPFGDSSAIPTYYVSRLASSHVPMVLSGDGGDENFAGYGSYAAWMRWMNPIHKTLWRRAARFFAQYIAPQKYPRPVPSLDSWLRLVNYLDAKQRLDLWRVEFKHLPEQRLDFFEKEFSIASAYSLCSRVQYLDIKTYLPFDILTKIDIASMMHGLETRTPIVDIRVVEFAATIPQFFNIQHLKNGDWQGKLLLKKLLGQYFPTDFISRNKKGFAVPLKKWFASGGALHAELKDRLLGEASLLHEFFNPLQIKKLIDENNTGPLWLLFFLEEWLRQNRVGVEW